LDEKIMNYIWIGLGSAVGGMCRYGLSGLVARHAGETFPLGTLIVNVTGCLVIGIFAGLTGTEGRLLVSPSFRQFVMLGVLGGYTTFSSFGLQTLNLAREGEWFRAGENAGLSFILCLLAVWLGHAAALWLNQMGGDKW
jgi:CrcB protein